MTGIKPIWLVTARELKERLRATSFRILTLALAVLAAGGIIAIDVVPRLFEGGTPKVAVVSGENSGIEAVLQRSSIDLNYEIEVVQVESREAGLAALENGDIDALLAGGDLLYEEGEDQTLTAVINRALYFARLPTILEQLDLTEAEALPLIAPRGANVEVVGEPSPADDEERRGVSAISAIGLYVALALYGNWVLLGVAEEKASRVVEVLLGLLRPEDLLAGKTIGIMLVAIIQILASLGGVLVGLAVIGRFDVPPVALDVGAASVVYLLGGLLLYSMLYAAIGATVSRQAEAHSASTPVTMLLLVPYFLSLSYIPEEPDGIVALVLSIFPLSSPLIMPTRVALGSPSAVEIGASLAFLLAATGFVAWLGGQVYSGAILSSRRVRIMDALRNLRLRGASGPGTGV